MYRREKYYHFVLVWKHSIMVFLVERRSGFLASKSKKKKKKGWWPWWFEIISPVGSVYSPIPKIVIIRETHFASVVWNWYHRVAIAYLYQPSPLEEADVKSQLQRSDTGSTPTIDVVFFFMPWITDQYTFVRYTKLVNEIGTAVAKVITFSIMTT